MKMSKGGSSKGRVTDARVGHTHKPMGKMSGKGAGVTKRDSAVAHSAPGGSTLKYRSGDVKRTSFSMAKYGRGK